MVIFRTFLLRDLRRSGIGWVGVSYLLAVLTTFAFAIGPDLPLLRRLAPALAWSGVLLALVVACQNIFEEDYRDGTVDRLRAENVSLAIYAAGIMTAKWIGHAVPLVPAALLLGLAFGLHVEAAVALAGAILLGTPAVVAIVSIASAIVGNRSRRSVVLPLVALPLCVPIVVFGVEASRPNGVPAAAVLLAVDIVAVLVAPFAAGRAIVEVD